MTNEDKIKPLTQEEVDAYLRSMKKTVGIEIRVIQFIAKAVGWFFLLTIILAAAAIFKWSLGVLL